MGLLHRTRRPGQQDPQRPRGKSTGVIAGEKTTRTPRFVTTNGDARTLDQTSLARARKLVGLKGYITNITHNVMSPAEVISNYHDLWHVEQSFRMSKTDLAARPMFHHTKDAIEAHLTIVFTALAVTREVQTRTGLAIRNVLRQLRPLPSRSTTPRVPTPDRPRTASHHRRPHHE